MMKKLFLIFSHQLTPDQREDAVLSLSIDPNGFVSLPESLQSLWSNIPSNQSGLIDYLKPFREWLESNCEVGDYVFISGDLGAVYLMVNVTRDLGLIPIYSTTERKVLEKKMPDGTIKAERIFKHKIFREYGK